MKKKTFVSFMLAFTLALGAIVFSLALGDNINLSAIKAEDTPMRIDLSYENKQLTNDTNDLGTYRLARVKTYRNNTIALLQSGVSYIDESQQVRLSLDGWFGNIGGDSGVERNDIRGLLRIHFVNWSNIKVEYSWSAIPGTVYTELPDANGDVCFSGLKPSYFRVSPAENAQVLFSSCEIHYDCVAAPAPSSVTVSNVSLRQSHYDADPGDLYVYDDPATSWAAHLENKDYFYAQKDTAFSDLDKHTMFMSFDLNKPLAGKTHYEGVRLDDPFVTDLVLEPLGGESKVGYGEHSVRVSFRYKGFAAISDHEFKVVGYYRKEVSHSVVSVDNIRQQADNTLPKDSAVTVQSLVTFIAFAKPDPFTLSSIQVHIAHTIFSRSIQFKDLVDLHLDADPFTAIGEHELSFRLDSRYPIHGTYLVYNESNFIKSVSFNRFKEQIEPGENLAAYFDGGYASVTLRYQDGTSNVVNINASNVDLSLVNDKVEGTYPYYVTVAGYRKVQRFVSVVISSIGDETGADIYAPTESTKGSVYAYGIDDYGMLAKFYITSIVAKDTKYRATCHLEDSDDTFERFGTYAIDEINDFKEIVLFGQLWSSRLKFKAGNNANEFTLLRHAEIENDQYFDDTVYTPDEDSYMFAGMPFHFYSSPYNEIKIDYSDEMHYRTTCTYLNEEKTRFSFQYPFYLAVVTFEATIYETEQGAKMIHVEEPAYLQSEAAQS